ncbi:hypothetical protein GW17_00022209 [Ensete ventricosum]|nr:hypothetical protein GW17_00022209 [Ensete ventricosum]
MAGYVRPWMELRSILRWRFAQPKPDPLPCAPPFVSTSADLQVLGSNSGRHVLYLRGRWKKGTEAAQCFDCLRSREPGNSKRSIAYCENRSLLSNETEEIELDASGESEEASELESHGGANEGKQEPLLAV